MNRQYQIKISVSKKLNDLIEEKANRLGIKKSTYCFNILLEQLRKKENI